MTMLMMQIVLTMRRKMEVPAAVLIEDPECLPDVLLQVGLFELLGHHREELLKVNLAVAITVHLHITITITITITIITLP